MCNSWNVLYISREDFIEASLFKHLYRGFSVQEIPAYHCHWVPISHYNCFSSQLIWALAIRLRIKKYFINQCGSNHFGEIWTLLGLKPEYFRRTKMYSLSGRTSYRNISWRLGAGGFGLRLSHSLQNLTETSAAALPRCMSNLRAIRSL